MSDGLKRQLPTIAVISLLAILAGGYALFQVRANVGSLDVDAFSNLIILLPCALMLVASFAIMLVSHEIGRQLYLVVLGICLVGGIASMIVTSNWMSNADIASQLIANSGDGATITPVLDSPLIIIRDLAAYVVSPTVGLIAGAWLGSRLHPLKSFD